MKQIVQNMKNGETQIVDAPVPAIKPGYILIKTAASLVSSGTERMLVDFAEKNLLGKARSRPDLLHQVLEKAQRDGVLTTLNAAFNRLDQPIVLGYSSSGTVIQVGSDVRKFKPGDRVACAGGGFAVHANYALIPENLAVKISGNVTYEEGAFATVSTIALNGIRLANPQVGETSAVIGLGLLGLITAQILIASGCSVIGIDISAARIKKAKKLGVKADLNQKVVANYTRYTHGRGFDHVFICADTKSDETVALAGEIARDRATIVAVGAVGMDIPRKSYYEKELTFKVSRSYGPGRYDPSYEEKGNDYPTGYIRWTEGRNLEAIVDMIKNKQLDVSSLISHRYPIENAKQAYDLLSGRDNQDYLGIIITYPELNDSAATLQTIRLSSSHNKVDKSKLNIGVLGAGNYANAVFLPIVSKHHKTNSLGIASSKGLNAQHSARKFGFTFASSNEDEIILNKDIDITTILTRHDTHASLVVKALKAGKHVYCEKPLAIDRDGIDKIVPLLKKKVHPYLTVGFNRRFAPFAVEMKSLLENREEPLFVNYRINAGVLPKNHWLHDRAAGGGRLIGEGCHFIDFLIFLVGMAPTWVHTRVLPNNGNYSNDNFTIAMDFPDGSIGNISYLANGGKTLGKEYVEVFHAGKTIILDDFRKIQVFSHTVDSKRARFKQDKGHAQSWDAFMYAIMNNLSEPIPYDELIMGTYTALACDHSMRIGESVNIANFINGK